MRRRVIILISAMLLSTSVGMNPANANGLLDTSFDTDGKVTTEIGSGSDFALSIAIQSDGKIIAVGSSGLTYSERYFTLARYNSDGSLDLSFGVSGKVITIFGGTDDGAKAVQIQSDGKIVVAGYSFSGSKHDFALARYNIDGSLDITFGTNGKVTTAIGSSSDFAQSVAIQSDGKIVAAGYSNSGLNFDFALARYNIDGSLDITFGTNGKVSTPIGSSTDILESIAIQSDGRLVAAGYSYNGTDHDFALARYTRFGLLDVSFDTDGIVTTAVGAGRDIGRSIAIQVDGKIVAAGYSYNGSNDDFALARYNVDGSLDVAFDTDGIVTTAIGSGSDVARSLAIQSDGKIAVAGSSSNGSNDDFALARYNSDGSLDISFDTDGKVTTPIGSSTDLATSIAIQGDGRIIAAGYSDKASNVDFDFALARYGIPFVAAVDSAVAAAAAAAAAAVRREAEKKAARLDIVTKFEAAETVTIETFRQADIGVPSDDFQKVVAEILSLPKELRADILQVLKVAYKYEIVAKVSSDKVKSVYSKDLIAVGLIPAESAHKATLTAILRKLPASMRSDYLTIKATLDSEMAKIQRRKDRLAVLLGRTTG